MSLPSNPSGLKDLHTVPGPNPIGESVGKTAWYSFAISIAVDPKPPPSYSKQNEFNYFTSNDHRCGVQQIPWFCPELNDCNETRVLTYHQHVRGRDEQHACPGGTPPGTWRSP